MDTKSEVLKPADSDALNYNTTPNQYVTVHGIKLAYRMIGNRSDAPTLVLFQHFTGTMDDWDQDLVEKLAATRPVLIFENAGIGASQGEPPDSVSLMAHYAEGFLDALQLSKIDALGFSLGGAVVQQLLADRPELVRKAILVGTGPQGAEGFDKLPSVIADKSKESAEKNVPLKALLFFTDTREGRQAGLDFVKRINNHTIDPEPIATPAAVQAQAKAYVTWGLTPANYRLLEAIKQPVLIVNGNNDLIAPTINSYVLYQHIPKAYLSLYPDSGHGSFFQYSTLFVSQANAFLAKEGVSQDDGQVTR
ncbi:alpha/beta fold hydrolase [Terriglobus sp. TAA 43]|uniref:alpha/beta fold hydrolase n=1 Tax=Terriglobus sp. TAA 43 TaxID=278961 RepID=UPI00068D8D4C|nr:alpha/beta hydrolase [Terriglobus sp. TAA 43]